MVRKVTMAGTPITLSEGNYTIGESKFHESEKTFFKRSLKTNDGVEYYYSVRDIVFFLENADGSFAEYRRKAVQHRVTAVVEQDRKQLKSYLSGELESCPQIDQDMVNKYKMAQQAIEKNSGASRIETDASQVNISQEQMKEQRARHAARLEQTIDQSSVKVLHANESVEAKSQTEKIDELKNLRKMHKRKSADIDGIGMEELNNSSASLFDQAFIDQDRQLLSRLRTEDAPSNTRATVLQSRTLEFSSVLKLFNDRILKPKELRDRDKHAADKREKANNQALTEAQSNMTKTHRSPIILVPNAMTATLTCFNAKEFLVDGVYISVEGKKKKDPTAKLQKILTLNRAMGSGHHVELYKVYDDVSQLSPTDWDRVVAVFVTGKLWQFKGWKYSNPIDLFDNVMGVYLHIDGRPIEPTIKSWNCKVLKVNEFKDFVNSGASKNFWVLLDEFIRLNKPALVTRAIIDQAVTRGR